MSTTLTPPESVLPVIKLPAGDITVDDIVRVKQDIAKEIEAIRKKSANSKPSIILDFGKVKSTDPAFITDVIFPLNKICYSA